MKFDFFIEYLKFTHLLLSMMQRMELEELLAIVHDQYPAGLDEFAEGYDEHPRMVALRNLSYGFKDDQRWKDLLAAIDFGHYVDDRSLAWQGEPAHMGIAHLEDTWAVALFFRISLIAPVYDVFFSNNRLGPTGIFRFHPETDKEERCRYRLVQAIEKHFKDYQPFHSGDFNCQVEKLGNINVLNPRKPYLDECLFGTYMSFHG